MGVTKARAWLAGAVLAGMMAATGVEAGQVQFKTMELRTIAGPQEPVFVTVAHRHRRSRTQRPRYVVRRRSKRKSAAIVGGSAAGGALIGALAGGGKGAGIGAAAGGGAAYLYDRKTHKKRVRVE